MFELQSLAFHMQTAFLSAGFLFVLVPISGWIMLKGQGTHAPALWFSGGLAMGVSFVLIGLRSQIPAWTSYLLGNAFLVLGNVLHILALRKELGRSTPMIWPAAVFAGVLVPHEYFRVALDNAYLRFTWVVWCSAFLIGITAWYAWHIVKREGGQSARWLTGVYALMTFLLILRGTQSLLGMSPPEATAPGVDSMLTLLGVLVTAVLGNLAIMGIYLERLGRQTLAYAVERERQWVISKFGDRLTLEDRGRSLDEMTAVLAHEMAQPVTGIIIENDLIKMRSARLGVDDPQLRQAVQNVSHYATRARDIINSVQRMAKSSELRMDRVDMRDVVGDVQALFAWAIREGKLTIAVHHSGMAAQVMGDAVLLSLIFLNLFRNALQSRLSSAPVHISVTLDVQGQQVLIRVEDDGPGFAPELIDRVGQMRLTTKHEGMGVGLALCRRITEQHGGRLNFHNRVDSSGAVAELVLPRAETAGLGFSLR